MKNRNLKYCIKVLLTFVLLIHGHILLSSNNKFYSINTIHGISIRETNSICKDDDGFIWASSKTGILRLTEDDYRVYQLPYETADVISVKLSFRDGKLVAFTNNGQLFEYNSIYDRFDFVLNMSTKLNFRHLSIGRVLLDNLGDYWISSSIGLFKYHNDSLEGILHDWADVFDIHWYNENSFFIARENGIAIFNTTELKSKIIHTANHKISSLYYDKKVERLWCGTSSNGLYYYNFKDEVYKSFLPGIIPKQPILAIEPNSDSTLLIGVDGQGIWELSKRSERVTGVHKESSDNPSSLRGNGVYDIYCDKNGRIWVCTYSGGVSFYDQATPLVRQINHVVNNSNSLINNDVNSVLEDSRGNIWFATNNGISQWKVAANQWKTFYYNTQAQAQVFLSLAEDNEGRIWAGTYSSGFYILDGNTGREIAHYGRDESNAFSISYVFDILKDYQGDIWVGGVQGDLICYLSNEKQFRKYSTYPIYVISELRPGVILLGCTYGLISIEKATGESKNLVQGYLVTDVQVFGDHIWMATSGDGLVEYSITNNTTKKYTTNEGLPSNFLNSILVDDGFIWIGTESGLCRFDPESKFVQTYSSILPLSNVSFNQNSNFKRENGELIWGTNNGAVVFHPHSIEQIETSGRIFFQDIIIAGKSVRHDPSLVLDNPIDKWENIKLKYNQNTLTLELIPLGKSTAGSKFSWKLEGYDSDWNSASSNRSITYTNIPNGDFVLKIRMFDTSLSQLISEREIGVNVLPPFWQTIWFRASLLTILISIVSFAMMYYVAQLKKKHSEDKIRFFSNMTHDIRTSLTLISAPIEELNREKNISEKGRLYLNLAIEQIRRLSTVSTQLLDFQKVDVGKEQLSLKMVDIIALVNHRRLMFDSLAQSKKITIRFEKNLETFLTAVDETMIEKVIDNLISNAIKYSHPDDEILLKIQCSKEKWTLDITDRGIGISRKAQRQLFKEFYRGENAVNSKIVGSGIGLLLVKGYISMHEGTIDCVSEEDKGTTFTITVPYKEVEQKVELRDMKQVQSKLVSEGNFEAESQVDVASQQLLRVLVVEDNDDLRKFLQLPLQEEFQVELAEDGERAWELIQLQMPDIVVSDVMMPKMNGFDLCKRMKSTYETSHIPIILLTALSEKDDQMHGLGLGADDYLTKPFDMQLLKQRIKSIIKNREVIREKALKLIKGDNEEPIFANELNDKFVKKAFEIVQKYISDPDFGKDSFASEMNVSSSLLYKKIKSLTDQSPSDFIKTIRLTKALQYLQESKISVTEVSELCGFTSVGYFSTVFKKHYGKSPTDINS